MSHDEDRKVDVFVTAHFSKATKAAIICVYKNPSDYPGKYVARLWDEDRPTNLICVANSYQEIIRAKPNEMVIFPRDPSDDPKIVETWI